MPKIPQAAYPMEYLRDGQPVYFSNERRFIEKRGATVWELICDVLPCDEHFTRARVIEILQSTYGLSARTATNYTYAVVDNLLRMPEGGLFPVGGPGTGNPQFLRFHDKNGY